MDSFQNLENLLTSLYQSSVVLLMSETMALVNTEQPLTFFSAVSLNPSSLLPVETFQSFPEFPTREEHAVQNWSWLFPHWEGRHSLRKFTGLEGQPLSNIWGSFPWNVGNPFFSCSQSEEGNDICHSLLFLLVCWIGLFCILWMPYISVFCQWKHPSSIVAFALCCLGDKSTEWCVSQSCHECVRMYVFAYACAHMWKHSYWKA